MEGRSEKRAEAWVGTRSQRRMRQLHLAAQRHLHEVRYVWVNDGVFVISSPSPACGGGLGWGRRHPELLPIDERRRTTTSSSWRS
jgi:hypothetical protein